MSYQWKDSDIIKLKKLIKDGKSVDEIAEALGRTINAIEIKVNRLGLQVFRPNREWTSQEEKKFARDWANGEVSMNIMEKKYKRTENALKIKANRMGLGARPYNVEFLSATTISEEMGVSLDKVYNWCKDGLKRHRNHSGKVKYVININDLLRYLKNHQDVFNASGISEYLFVDEPQWLKDKRVRDAEEYAVNQRLPYSNQDDKDIVLMNKLGKQDSEIAKAIGRSSEAVRLRKYTIGVYSKWYTVGEEDFLKKVSRYLTVDEILEYMPNRTAKGIEYKCNKMGIPYHLSKNMCEQLPEGVDIDACARTL